MLKLRQTSKMAAFGRFLPWAILQGLTQSGHFNAVVNCSFGGARLCYLAQKGATEKLSI
jgi:hypothetical protein